MQILYTHTNLHRVGSGAFSGKCGGGGWKCMGKPHFPQLLKPSCGEELRRVVMGSVEEEEERLRFP